MSITIARGIAGGGFIPLVSALARSSCDRAFAVLGLATLWGLAGCVSPPSEPTPPWVTQAKEQDSGYFYTVGHGIRAATEPQAREAAFRDGLGQFCREVYAQVEVRDASVVLQSGFELRGVEQVPSGSYTRRRSDGWEAYVQLSWPRAERDLVIERLKLGSRLNGLWTEAQAAAAAKQWDEAIVKVNAILLEFHDPLNVRFTLDQARTGLESFRGARRAAELNAWWVRAQALVQAGQLDEAQTVLAKILEPGEAFPAGSPSAESVKLLSGEICERQADVAGARKWYEVLAKDAVDPVVKRQARARVDALPPLPRFWPMKERWGGVRVALLCAIREGGAGRVFPDLAAVLQKDCLESRMAAVDISGRVSQESVTRLFGDGDTSAAVDVARTQGAGVVLIVLYDIDPASRNRTEDIGGVAMPVPDAVVKFILVRTESGQPIHRGQFKAVTHGRSESRLAPYAASILITNYLVPSCPTVK